MEAMSHRILCVDDEPNVLNALKRLLWKEKYKIFTATGGQEGLDVLAKNDIHLIICDQRMPGMSGNEFFEIVRERYPDIIRITLTGYTEVDSITESINKGHIYKFFVKPWNDTNLKLEIRQALEQYELAMDNRRLHQKVLEQNEALQAMNSDFEKPINRRPAGMDGMAPDAARVLVEELPIPVIGLSRDCGVVLVNRAARDFFESAGPGDTAGKLEEYFACGLSQLVSESVQTCSIRHLIGAGPSEGRAGWLCIPLSDPDSDLGVVLTMDSIPNRLKYGRGLSQFL